MDTAASLGLDRLGLRLPAGKRIAAHGGAETVASLADPLRTLGESLESPLNYPALRLALTPDDRIAVVVDPCLPMAKALVGGVIEHILQAGVQAAAITIVLPETPLAADWLRGCGPWDKEVKIEIHDPEHRDKLRYLAATRNGRRVYLNRTVVDADQTVAVTGRSYDWFQGHLGLAKSLFPTLSDRATLQESADRLDIANEEVVRQAARQEADEVVWLLGAPFFVQIVAGAGDKIAHVISGVLATEGHGEELLAESWSVRTARKAALVIADLTGEPSQMGMSALAAAAAKASQFVEPNGAIALLAPFDPELDQAMKIVCDAPSPEDAARRIYKQKPANAGAALQWLTALGRARLYLFGPMQAETVEEMLAIPVDKPEQLQKLVDAASSYLILTDAHKIVARANLDQEAPAAKKTKRARPSR